MAKDNSPKYTLQWNMSIAEVPQKAWDDLAAQLNTPLLDWEWLRQMEVSGSVTPETGWLPCHLTVWSDSTLVAAAPLYVKGHSQGEFVWDYMWADVADQLKVDFYPKLIGMSPATPAVGYRFLIAPGEDEEFLTAAMLDAIDTFCEQNNLSGCGFHFVDPEWRSMIEPYGYSGWLHQSFEWVNQDFHSFDDYLAGFNKNQRRNIRRERKAMQDQSISLEAYTGEDLPKHFFPLMFHYYERTNDQFGPWAAKYLTDRFFSGLYDNFRHRLLFLAAFGAGKKDPIAMSFLLTKDDTIIGRYWGTERMANALHFNACYYSPIEWAISQGIKRFDPGAGSPHKLRRGFFAVPNYSMHKFRDPTLRAVMEQHIERINIMEMNRIDAMNATLPLKSEYLPEPISTSQNRRPR